VKKEEPERKYKKEEQMEDEKDSKTTVTEKGDTAENRKFVAKLVSEFLKQVVIKSQQFKDELLFSAIQLLLTVPIQFVDVPTLLPALSRALEIGRGFVFLAFLTHLFFSFPILVSLWFQIRSCRSPGFGCFREMD
jgi:hypothetical protein